MLYDIFYAYELLCKHCVDSGNEKSTFPHFVVPSQISSNHGSFYQVDAVELQVKGNGRLTIHCSCIPWYSRN